jgi:hypothetical protein
VGLGQDHHPLVRVCTHCKRLLRWLGIPKKNYYQYQIDYLKMNQIAILNSVVGAVAGA